jgi:hypothetical protein
LFGHDTHSKENGKALAARRRTSHGPGIDGVDPARLHGDDAKRKPGVAFKHRNPARNCPIARLRNVAAPGRSGFAAIVKFFPLESKAFIVFKSIGCTAVQGYRAPVKSRFGPYFMA